MNPMLAGAVSKFGRGIGMPSDSWGTSPEKAASSDAIAGQAVQKQDPQALKAAAAVLLRQGRQSEAIQLLQMASDIEAKQMAVLEEGKVEIAAGVEKAKEEKALSMAKRLAETKGDKEAVKGLEGGLIAPKDYFEAMRKASAAQEPVSLADGAMLVGPDGKILAENRKDFRPPDPSGAAGEVSHTSQEKKDITRLAEEGRSHATNAARMETLATQFGNAPVEQGGVNRTVDEAFAAVTGNRDAMSLALTTFYELKNSQAMNNLPPGAASDADVALAMEGVPPKNASNSEIASWLRGVAKIEKMASEYFSLSSDHIRENCAPGLNKGWKKEKPPKAAVSALKGSPTEANKEAFKAHYGWLPEGL